MKRVRVVVWLPLVFLLVSPCAAKPPATPKHVVLVVLGGGVRVADLTDKARMPNVAALAREEGRVVKNVKAEAADGVSAVARLLTGTSAPGPDLATQRPAEPTIGEYVRAGLNLPAEQVWYVAFDASAADRESHSSHPNFGPAVAPRRAFGMGAIAEPLKTFLEVQGRPVPLPKDGFELLRGLRTMNARTASPRLPPGIRLGLPAFDRVERAVLNELDRRASLVRGPNPADERAWRAAQTVLQIHRPVLTVIRLGEAEIADTSPDKYRSVLRANDRSFARLRARIEADAVMRKNTLYVLVPDRGRVQRDGALPAEPGPVSVVLSGPGAKRWRPKGPRQIEDVCPTIGALLGVPTPDAGGGSWIR